MILNRLLTESANIAAAIVNSSGMNVGGVQEVSGGAQGMMGRAGQTGANKSVGANTGQQGF